MGLGREAANREIAADHDHSEIDAGEKVGQIVVDLIDFLIAVAQLVVDGAQLLVGGLQLFLGCFQFFVGALEFFVAGKDLFVGGLQLFIGGLLGFDDRLEVFLGGRELLLEPGDSSGNGLGFARVTG